MNEGENFFEASTSAPTREMVITALSKIRTNQESQAAAKLLGEFLDTIDTSNMSLKDRLRIGGWQTHCRKPGAEIDNASRYIEILEKILGDEK